MRRLRGSLTALVVLVAALVMMPGPAGASHINPGAPPSWNFVRTFPNCNSSNPNAVIKFMASTPFGSFPATHCKDWSDQFGPSGVFVTEIDLTAIGMGIVSLSGNVVCVTILGGHQAWERDLITSSNSVLFAPGLTLIGRLVDNDGYPPSPPPFDEAAFILAPPGATCPPLPISTAPISSGNVVVHQFP